MASPARQQALFELCRALSSTLDGDELCRRFAAHADAACGGRARLWLLDPDATRMTSPGEPGEARRVSPDWRDALDSQRPRPAASAFVVPFACGGTPAGLVEVTGASSADLASGGMRFWRSLAEIVGGALANARLHARARAELERLRAQLERREAA